MSPTAPTRAWSRALRALAIVLLAGVALLVVSRDAAAAKWVELRVVRDDVRLELVQGGAGRARIEHRVAFLVSGGPLMSLVVRDVDADAAPDVEARVVPREVDAAGGSDGALAASVRRVEVAAVDGQPARVDLEVTFDGGAGIRRGAWVLTLRYATDLASGGVLRGDGPTRSIAWTGPTWADGLDTTRAVFVVPAAPTPPSVVDPGDDGEREAPVFLSTLRRTSSVDELEVVKPYAPRGERVTWTARVDARALGLAAAPRAPAAAPPRRDVEPLDRALRAVGLGRSAIDATTLGWVAGGLLVVVWALLVVAKTREAMRTHAATGARARPLLPLPLLARAPLSAALVAAGVWLELSPETATVGALLVVAGALAAAHRAPSFKIPPRGPGRWLPVSPAEAYASPPRPRGAWLDGGTRAGGAVFVALLALLFAAGAALIAHGMVHRGVLVALDAAALFPIFLTGRIADLPPDPATAPARLLRAIGSRVEVLAGREAVRAVPRIRVPRGGADADDLRLALVPARPHVGLRSVVVGATYGLGAFGWVALPEILVRVQTGSPAEAALAPVARRARAMEGARDDERVLSFVPRLPTAKVTAALAAAVVARVAIRPGGSPPEARSPAPREAPARAAA